MADALTIQLEGKSYKVEDFTLGEVEFVEEYVGTSLDQLNPSSMKAAVAFVTVIKRRDEPAFTVEDARNLKLSIFNDDEAPADGGKGKRPTKRGAAA